MRVHTCSNSYRSRRGEGGGGERRREHDDDNDDDDDSDDEEDEEGKGGRQNRIGEEQKEEKFTKPIPRGSYGYEVLTTSFSLPQHTRRVTIILTLAVSDLTTDSRRPVYAYSL